MVCIFFVMHVISVYFLPSSLFLTTGEGKPLMANAPRPPSFIGQERWVEFIHVYIYTIVHTYVCTYKYILQLHACL